MSYTLIIPMGGRSLRMGMPSPSKPMSMVGGRRMFEHVIENMPSDARIVLIVREEEHCIVSSMNINATVLCEDEPKGVIKAILSGFEHADSGPVMIAHADQVLEWCPEHFKRYAMRSQCPVLPISLSYTEQAGAAAIDGICGTVRDLVPKVTSSLFGLCGTYWFPSVEMARGALEDLGDTDLVIGQHYVECGLLRLMRKGSRVDYYPVRKVWLMDTLDQVAVFERHLGIYG